MASPLTPVVKIELDACPTRFDIIDGAWALGRHILGSHQLAIGLNDSDYLAVFLWDISTGKFDAPIFRDTPGRRKELREHYQSVFYRPEGQHSAPPPYHSVKEIEESISNEYGFASSTLSRWSRFEQELRRQQLKFVEADAGEERENVEQQRPFLSVTRVQAALDQYAEALTKLHRNLRLSIKKPGSAYQRDGTIKIAEAEVDYTDISLMFDLENETLWKPNGLKVELKKFEVWAIFEDLPIHPNITYHLPKGYCVDYQLYNMFSISPPTGEYVLKGLYLVLSRL